MQDKRIGFFDKLAKNWDSNQDEVSLKRVIDETNIKKGSAVCDVGTGTGVLLPYIVEKVEETGKVIAIDYSSEMIKKAKEKWGKLAVEFVVADIHNTGFPDSYFDYVICNACFPHFEKKKIALKEIHRILKKGGTIVISHPRGREFVNKLHREACECIKRDRVFEADILAKLLKQQNFTPLKTIDEPNFYFVSAVKS